MPQNIRTVIFLLASVLLTYVQMPSFAAITDNAIPAPSVRYIYVPDQQHGVICQYHLDLHGRLLPLSPPSVKADISRDYGSFARGYQTLISMTSQFAYVLNRSKNTIISFRIANDGCLTLPGQVMTPTVKPVTSMIFSPDGNAVYLLCTGVNAVAQFSIQADGSFTPLTPASVDTGKNPSSMVIGLDGHHAYVTNTDSNTISQYSIDKDGTLRALPDFSSTEIENPINITLNQTGNQVYVTLGKSNSIARCRIGKEGRLYQDGMQLGHSLNDVFRLQIANFIIDPTGQYLYCLPSYGTYLEQYKIRPNGKLMVLYPHWTPVCKGADSLQFVSNGHYAVAANSLDGNASLLRVNSNGTLTEITSSRDRYHFQFKIDPSGHFAYSLNFDEGTVTQFRIGKEGLLFQVTTVRFNPPAGYPKQMTIAPDGRHVYVTGNGLTVLRVDPSGGLTIQSTTLTAISQRMSFLTFHPMAPFAYAVDIVSGKVPYPRNPFDFQEYLVDWPTHRILVFHVQENGELEEMPEHRIPLQEIPLSLAINLDGNSLYSVYPSEINQYPIAQDGILNKPKPLFIQSTHYYQDDPSLPVIAALEAGSSNLVFDATHHFAYLQTGWRPYLFGMRIDKDGTLTQLTSAPSDGDTTNYMGPLCFAPEASMLGTGIETHEGINRWMRFWKIASDGQLQPLPSQGALYQQGLPLATFGRDAHFLYLYSELEPAIRVYQIAFDGRLYLQATNENLPLHPWRDTISPLARAIP